MKKTLIALALTGLIPAAAAADVSKEDIKKLAAAGISDEVILTYLRTHGPVPTFTADDLVELKQAGVSERVLAELAGRPAAAPAPPPAPAPRTEVVERTVYVPSSPTYVIEPAPRIVYVDSWVHWSCHSLWPVRFSPYYYPRVVVSPPVRVQVSPPPPRLSPPAPPRSYASIRVGGRSRG